eukprot:CAMPEP_0194030902 /NCGR_PEP_ID=MMETSP0009_2-20130614/4223_1 /TAXON_ID=210454 /ORGANISM="Grammatophora oceanica, Strain CCMP 410" /LENGTH=52 /DNA_ID=CAMNT_0038670929 /DNA_START=97 /DNA_END=251 /DNA_ORIENTATION=-
MSGGIHLQKPTSFESRASENTKSSALTKRELESSPPSQTYRGTRVRALRARA